jgi:hypothetical protein
MRPAVSLALLPLAVAGCMVPPVTVESQRAPVGPDPQQVARAVARAADQVKGCYRSPKLNRVARQIVTVLRVSYTPEGNLATSPVVSGQAGITEENRIYSGRMARAAIEAVERCVPLRLPQELYKGGWDEFDLTFSPRGLA